MKDMLLFRWRYLCLLFCLLSSVPVFCQKEGAFQQQVDYQMEVSLDTALNRLSAFQQMYYHNLSSDTLDQLFIHLYANAYRDGTTFFARHHLAHNKTDFYFSDPAERGYIDSLSFIVDGKSVLWQYHDNQWDVCVLKLPRPLFPGDSVVVSTPFVLQLPSRIFSRSGVDRANLVYQLTQWYPKAAVYDANGWHLVHYSDCSEYYSNFGNYDVSITLPSGFALAATGAVVEYAKQGETSCYRLLQDNVHDFAWFASAHWVIDSRKVLVPGTNREVELRACRFPGSSRWDPALDYMQSALDSLSRWVGPYPYPTLTAIQPASVMQNAMEYPTICVLPVYEGHTEQDFDEVMFHEICHNWFYGVLASNEFEEPWLDEGFTTFLHYRYSQKRYGGKKDAYTRLAGLLDLKEEELLAIEKRMYFRYALSRGLDLPADLPARAYDCLGYYTMAYFKPAIALDYLESFLGEETMLRCLQAYFDQYAFKHPSADDVRRVFEQVSGQSLDWFFDQLIGSTKKMDYRIAKVIEQPQADMLLAKIIRRGSYTGPFPIGLFRGDSLLYIHWVDGFDKKEYVLGLPKRGGDRLVIDPLRRSPDMDYTNNTYYLDKSNCRLPALKFGTGLQHGTRKEGYYVPFAAWNIYDKWMPGIVLHNVNLFEKKLEFALAPMYSISQNQLNGLGALHWNMNRPVEGLQQLVLGLGGKRFSYAKQYSYSRLRASALVELCPASILSVYRHRFMFSFLRTEEAGLFENWYGRVGYEWENTSAQSPHRLLAQLEFHKDYARLTAELNKRLMYNQTKGMDVRLFGGSFLSNRSSYGGYNFYLSGNPYDYAYDHLLMARYEREGFGMYEFVENEGGFKMASAWSSHRWLLAMNVQSDLPGILPLKIFADIGTHANMENTPFKNKYLVYDAGISLQLLNNRLRFYLPLVYSDDLRQMPANQDKKFFERLRFSIRLNQLRPNDLRERIL